MAHATTTLFRALSTPSNTLRTLPLPSRSATLTCILKPKSTFRSTLKSTSTFTSTLTKSTLTSTLKTSTPIPTSSLYPSQQLNYNTPAYRVWLGFLIAGIIIAVLFPLIMCSPVFLSCWRKRKEKRGVREMIDLEDRRRKRWSGSSQGSGSVVGVGRPGKAVLGRERG
ncbi:hypothetical protein NX059_002781 [Plenodomus lindquistii]|nr:hypothetical protein NX059_002781 [Plenodomus lindquistii]